MNYAVIGNPVDQSLSPQMFNAAFKALNLKAQYGRVLISSDELETFMATFRKSPDWQGLNVTAPLKESILFYLDDLSTKAQKIKAVNTVYKKNNRLIGDNTDAGGFVSAFEPLVDFDDKNPLLILGAGGAARAVVYSLLEAGFENLILSNRSPLKAKGLVDEFKLLFPKAHLETLNFDEFLNKGCPKAWALIQTARREMDNMAWPSFSFLDLCPHLKCVADIVAYPLKTSLLKEAEKRHLKIMFGWEMLLNQALLAFEIFIQKPAPAEIMKQALLEALKD